MGCCVGGWLSLVSPLLLLGAGGEERGRVEPSLQLQVGNVPSRKYLVLKIDPGEWKGRTGGGSLPLRMEALNEAGEVLLSRPAVVPLEPSEVLFDYSSLPIGSYRCRVTALLPDGEEVRREASFRHPAPAAWLVSTLYEDYGKEDRVPRPWTPVQCAGREIRAWGRVLRWGPDSLLPSSICSQGVELLTRPLQGVVTLEGRSDAVPLGTFQVTERQKSRLSLITTGQVRGLTVTAKMVWEYDGFLWITLQVRDAIRDRKIQNFRVVASLDPAQTTLYQAFSRPLAGWIGQEPIRMPWRTSPTEPTVNFYHWFGNEDRGLGFTYTSLEHWAPQSEDNFCTLEPGPEARIYRINLVEKPVPLDGRTFQFGLQATPIKPLPPDYHSMMATTVQYEPWKAWLQMPENVDLALVWPEPNGVTMRGLQDPYHINVPAMEEIARYVHEKEVAFVGVASCPQKISPLNDEFEDYREEWQCFPESVLMWEGVPHYQNCGRSYTLRKWLFYGWAVENVQRFGLEGIYYDGWQAGTMACFNPHHGCGWVDAQGNRHLTVPVLEGREFNQRMILFLEDQVRSPYGRPRAAPPRKGFPQYHYWIHSWEFVPSVMGFATEWLTGEFAGWPLQGPSMLTPEGTYGRCLGLGLFRSRCLSTNWGVPNLFDALMWEHTENHPTDRQTLMAYAWLLPHGVPLGQLGYLNQRTVLEISGILGRFGSRQAHFTPGWRPNPYWRIEAPRSREVLVATWDHAPRKKVLAVVSNLQVDREQRVTLRWTGFADPQIRNARTGEHLELQGSRLQAKLAPESFILLEAEDKTG